MNEPIEIGDIYKDWQSDYHVMILKFIGANLYECLHIETGNTRPYYFDSDGWIKVA